MTSSKHHPSHCSTFIVAAVLLLLAFVVEYRHSFTNPFFQDDYLLLNMSQPLTFSNFIHFFIPISGFPYRPLGAQGAYWFMQIIFGQHLLSFHLFTTFLMLTTAILVYKIFIRLFADQWLSLLGTAIYLLSSIHYMSLFWVASFYFAQGALFFWVGLYFFWKFQDTHSPKWFWLSLVSYLVAMLTNEATLTLPVIILATFFVRPVSLRQSIQILKSYFPHLTLMGLFGVGLYLFRFSTAGLPLSPDYQLRFGPEVFSGIRWYLLRTLNLPEGIRFVPFASLITTIFIAWLGLLLAGLILHYRSALRLIRPIVFGAVIFVFGALPFFFLPLHQSSYYLEISIVGTAIIIVTLLSTWQSHRYYRLILTAFAGLFFIQSLFSVTAMNQTHWVSSRAHYAATLVPTIKSQCHQSAVIITQPSSQLHEAKTSLYYQNAAGAICHNKHIPTLYQSSDLPNES